MTAELFTEEIDLEIVAVLDALLIATRSEIAAAEILEHRAAALGALLSTSGPRYLTRATRELEEAFAGLQSASDARRFAAGRASGTLGISEVATLGEFAAVAPSPYGSALAATRVELVTLRRHLVALAEANTTALGQRMALVKEALQLVEDGAPATTYGRTASTTARVVRGVL